jgi:hypothetical protein
MDLESEPLTTQNGGIILGELVNLTLILHLHNAYPIDASRIRHHSESHHMASSHPRSPVLRMIGHQLGLGRRYVLSEAGSGRDQLTEEGLHRSSRRHG